MKEDFGPLVFTTTATTTHVKECDCHHGADDDDDAWIENWRTSNNCTSRKLQTLEDDNTNMFGSRNTTPTSSSTTATTATDANSDTIKIHEYANHLYAQLKYKQVLSILKRHLRRVTTFHQSLSSCATLAPNAKSTLHACPVLSIWMSNIGRVHFALREYDEALVWATEALNVYKCDDPQYLSTLWFNVGIVEFFRSKTSPSAFAISTLRQSLELFRTYVASIGVDKEDLNDSSSSKSSDLHGTLISIQSYCLLAEAKSTLDGAKDVNERIRLISLLTSLLPPNNTTHHCFDHGQQSSKFFILRELGLMMEGDFESASSYLWEAVRIQHQQQRRRESATDTTWLTNLATLELWALLGKCRLFVGRPIDAMVCFRHALRLVNDRESKHHDMLSKSDRVHVVIGSVLYNIGMIHASTSPEKASPRKREKAVRSFVACLDYWCLALPKDSTTIANVHCNIAVLLKEDGHLDKALKHLEDSNRILAQGLGPCHPQSSSLLFLMGEIYEQRSQYNQSLSMYQKALMCLDNGQVDQMMKQGKVHLSRDEVWVRIGRIQRTLGNLESAKDAFEDAMTIIQRREVVNGEVDDPQQHSRAKIGVLTDLGYLELDRGDRQAANAYLDMVSTLTYGRRLLPNEFHSVFSVSPAA